MANSDVVEFLVEGVSFMAPRTEFYLEHASSNLLAQIEDVFDGDGRQGQPVFLAGVQADEFQVFLDLLLLSSAAPSSRYTSTEWASVLRLATLWCTTRLRELAIAALSSSSLDAATRISLAQRFDVPQWLGTAYSELANRPTSLTPEEIRMIGVEAATRVLRMREGLGEGEVRVVDLLPSETDVASPVEGLTEREVEELVLFANPWDDSEVPPPRKKEEGTERVVSRETAMKVEDIARVTTPPDGSQITTGEKEPLTHCGVHADHPRPSAEEIEQIVNDIKTFCLHPPSTSSSETASHSPPSLSIHDAEVAVAQALSSESQATAVLHTARQAQSKAQIVLQSTENTLRRLDAESVPVLRMLASALRPSALRQLQTAQRDMRRADDAHARAMKRAAEARATATHAHEVLYEVLGKKGAYVPGTVTRGLANKYGWAIDVAVPEHYPVGPSTSKSGGAASQTKKDPRRPVQAGAGAWILGGLAVIGTVVTVVRALNGESAQQDEEIPEPMIAF